MILAQNQISQHKSTRDFPNEARIAISNGIERDDAVAELEFLGLPVRTINILEESRLGITHLRELMSHRPEDLLAIPNFGDHGFCELMNCLSRYHHLDEAKLRSPGPFESPTSG